MIENVYSNMPGKEEEYQVSGRRPPKNVRQAGYFTGDLRIYVEDYVHTFTRWLAEQDYSARCAAVLVGEFAKSEHTRDVYAYGTVVIENACSDGKVEMTSEIWTQVYETIKNYFPEGEIVGWFYGGTSFTEEEKEMLCQVHLDHFAGTDRILMLYDFLEREEEFYRYEGEGLVRQTGHYIYYEKNAEMQNYMVDKKQGKNSSEAVEDRAVKEVRARLGMQSQANKEETEKQAAGSRQPTDSDKANGGSKLLYTAGIVMAAVAVVTGASMIYNQERLKGFEQTLNQIIGAVQQGEENNGGQGGKEAENTSNGSIFDNPEVQETFQNGDKDNREPSEGNGENMPEPSGTTPAVTEVPNNKDADNNEKVTMGPEKPTGIGEKNNEQDGSGQGGTDNSSAGIGQEKTTPVPDNNGNSVGKTQTEGEEPADITGGPGENGETAATAGEDGLLDTSKYTVYIVQPGDTLVGICMKLYGSLENLEYIKGLNQISNENLIFAYQELLVP